MLGVPGMDEAGLICEHDELCPVTGAQFGHCPADVGLRGGGADDHSRRDLVVAEPVRYLGNNFAFAVGEYLEPACGLCVGWSRDELADQGTGNCGGEKCVAVGDDPQGMEQLFRLAVFQDEAARARAERLKHVLVEPVVGSW